LVLIALSLPFGTLKTIVPLMVEKYQCLIGMSLLLLPSFAIKTAEYFYKEEI